MNSTIPPSDDQTPPSTNVEAAMSDLLDQDGTSIDWSRISDEDRRQVVDLVWLDSLLYQSQHAEKLSASTNRTIDQVLTRLRSDSKEATSKTIPPAVQPPASAQRRPKKGRGWGSRLTVAAALFVAAIGWWVSQPQAAKAMFDQAMNAALTQEDRVYQVTITPFQSTTPPRTGRLTVRGGEKFVFERIGPLGGRLAIGGNGKEFWFAPPIGPVLVANSEDVIPEWSQKPDLDMPFLQITTILRRMRDAYRLTRLPSETLAGHDGPLNHLVADRRRRARGPFGMAPTKIELWTAPETGIVHRLVVHWSPENNARMFDRIELELTKEVSSTPDIYDYSHYAPDRSVRMVSGPQ